MASGWGCDALVGMLNLSTKQRALQAEQTKMAEELRESKEALQKRSQQHLAEVNLQYMPVMFGLISILCHCEGTRRRVPVASRA